MRFPRRLVRWVSRHGADWTEAEFTAWAEQVTPTFVKGTVMGLTRNGWRIVKFDPSTEDAERPIVAKELTADDL